MFNNLYTFMQKREKDNEVRRRIKIVNCDEKYLT